MARTDLEIVEQTNAIARIIYANMGYTVKDDHKFYERERTNYHPHEDQVWASACEIQELMTGTDAEDALATLED